MQQRTWDWDTLGMPRLDHVLKALPGSVPGTKQQPLTEQAAQAVAMITDADLERFIWEAASIGGTAKAADSAVSRARSGFFGLEVSLTAGVRELVQQSWRPLVFPSGKHPEEAYRFFSDPTETLYTLAHAYPHLPSELQERAARLVADWTSADGPLASPTGRARCRLTWGKSARRTMCRNGCCELRTISAAAKWPVCIRCGSGPT